MLTVFVGKVAYRHRHRQPRNTIQIGENGQAKARYLFDATNMMAGATVHGVGSVEYGYSGFRKRARKVEAFLAEGSAIPDPERDVRYALDLTKPYDNLLMARGEHSQSFVWGRGLVEARGEKPEDGFFYLHDHLGSPVRLLGADGGGGEPLAYDEFGVPLTGQGASTRNPFGFTGYQKEDVTGLWFAQARYYEPTLGRFNAEDIIHSGQNWYGYCKNNSLRFVDRNGLWGREVHEDETTKVAISIGIEENWAKEIGKATHTVDEGLFTNPVVNQSYHFNTSYSWQRDSREKRADYHYSQAVDFGTIVAELANKENLSAEEQQKLDENRKQMNYHLGMLLHPLQDIHAHGQIGAGNLIVSQHLFDWRDDNRTKADDIEYDWEEGSGDKKLIWTGSEIRLDATRDVTGEYLERFLKDTGLSNTPGFHTCPNCD